MIKKEELIKIGRFNKPHGIKGEIACSFTSDAFEEVENPFLICELDGIFVPFRAKEYRFTSGSSALIRLKTIDSEKKAKIFTNKDVFLHQMQLPENKERTFYTWNDFIGFNLTDETSNQSGLIVDIEDSTSNVLFILQTENGEIYVPAAEEMITQIDETQKQIRMKLPEGIFDFFY
ncbi:MAG: ribosome maturation factor RimM [Candidatus Symbiothrix sp.]|jgi:16S rRNA processing protein RimM|nr:ribosome maturation factor RimM [Candidatus Symbiothrix sp.]